VNIKAFCVPVLAAWMLTAQIPRIGAIQFYGLHKLSEQKLLHSIHVQPGDNLPPSKGDLEDELEKVPGVVEARVEAVCCENNRATLFIGIEEKGAPHPEFHTEPAGDAVLPPDIVDTYHKLLEAVSNAGRRGQTAEDLTAGESLMVDPDARALQEAFISFSRQNLPLLRKVLRESGDVEQRAIAATVIGYASDKAAAAADLEYALQDPDEAVRASALRAITAIAVLARQHPGLEIHISPTWFVEMLNSVVLSDRTRAAKILVTLTEQDPAGLEQIRERALDSVLEMARWKDLQYALPAFILAGRIAGLTDAEIQKDWSNGQRQAVIDKLLDPHRKKKAAAAE
jgi:hypothetical protein